LGWFKRGRVLENKIGGKEDEIGSFERKIGRARGTCSRKPHILF
jgi:hypothetical protein